MEEESKSKRPPTLGRVVHYCWKKEGQPTHRAAAIVTRVHESDICDLHVFFNVENDGMLTDGRYKITSYAICKPNGVKVWWEWPILY